MQNFQESFLSGANIDFIEGLHERFLRDPSSVDPSWREIFEKNGGGKPITAEPATAEPAPQQVQLVPTTGMSLADLALSQIMGLQSRV
ncbi:MAG TPA: hypothetical protein VFA20_23875, partial [Myxococcaceae bacterium]|nr:hypothetical protein [Myxococcaceae bacterium]